MKSKSGYSNYLGLSRVSQRGKQERVFYPNDFTANAQVVRIKSGDTVGKLARKYHTSVKEICAMNKIKPSTKLRVGRSIRVR